jgi:hypothetical protein
MRKIYALKCALLCAMHRKYNSYNSFKYQIVIMLARIYACMRMLQIKHNNKLYKRNTAQ